MNSTLHHTWPKRSALTAPALILLLAFCLTNSLPAAKAESVPAPKSIPVAAAPGTDFYSTFNVTTAGWAPVTGTWAISNHAYYRTRGLPGVVSSIYRDGTYGNMIYRAYVKKGTQCRTNCGDIGLIIRGNPASLGTWRDWQPEYWLAYANSGYWHVLYWDGSGNYTILKDWTFSSAISRGGWNTLKVTATGPLLRFYINGRRVWSRMNYSIASGQVGIGYYRDPDGGDLKVNWAKMTTVVTDEAPLGLDEVLDSGAPIMGFPGDAMHQSP